MGKKFCRRQGPGAFSPGGWHFPFWNGRLTLAEVAASVLFTLKIQLDELKALCVHLFSPK